MKQISLDSLATRINDKYAMSLHHQEQALIYAAQCGDELIQAKKLCKHGEWVPWVESNCNVQQTQANRYMRLATEMPELLTPNCAWTHNLPTITAALALIGAPDEVKDRVQEELDKGEKVTEADVKKWKAEVQKMSEEKDVLSGQVDTLQSGQIGLQSLLASAKGTETRLRENIALEIDKGVADELVAHNLKLQSLQAETDNLKSSLATQKKNQSKAIDKGVKSAIKKQQSEIDRKEGQLQALENRIRDLEQIEQSLEDTLGNIQEHKLAIKKIHDATQLIFVEWHNVAMEGTPPVEVLEDWKNTLKDLKDGLMAMSQYVGVDKVKPEMINL